MAASQEEFLTFLEQFSAEYPEVSNNRLFLTGESYCGKYLSAYTYYILQSNSTLPLAGTMIIDPYVTPVIQRQQNWNIPFALDAIDSNHMDQVSALNQKCLRAMSMNTTSALEVCEEMLEYIEEVSGNVLSYNIQLFEYDWDKVESPYLNMLRNSSKRDQLYASIHVNQSYKDPVYQSYSPEVG